MKVFHVNASAGSMCARCECYPTCRNLNALACMMPALARAIPVTFEPVKQPRINLVWMLLKHAKRQVCKNQLLENSRNASHLSVPDLESTPVTRNKKNCTCQQVFMRYNTVRMQEETHFIYKWVFPSSSMALQIWA